MIICIINCIINWIMKCIINMHIARHLMKARLFREVFHNLILIGLLKANFGARFSLAVNSNYAFWLAPHSGASFSLARHLVSWVPKYVPPSFELLTANDSLIWGFILSNAWGPSPSRPTLRQNNIWPQMYYNWCSTILHYLLWLVPGQEFFINFRMKDDM